VLGSALWTAWLSGIWQVQGGDYAKDYAASMNALLAGRVGAFVANLPTNGAGGSVLLRAPFALLGKWLGSDQLAIFRFGTLGCLLVLGFVGVWLAVRLPEPRVPTSTRLGLVAIYAGAPALLEAVFYGHPEEPLGAALAVAAVVLAGEGRSRLAGLALGLAVINKPWGVLALAPVLLVAGGAWRVALLSAGVVVGGWFLVIGLVDPARLSLAIHGAETSLVAHPQELWWPLAHNVELYPRPPAFLGAHARQIAVALAVVPALWLARRSHRHRVPVTTQTALALLSFGFALRCLLEPATHDYYQLPLVVALAAWELRARRSVAISLAVLVVLAVDFRRLNEAAAVVPFVVYLAVLLPVCRLLVAHMRGVGDGR
jgi:hypothetical protein